MQSNAIQKQSVANYAKVILTALQEVENTLSNETYLNQQNEFLRNTVENNQEILTFEKASYEIGKASKMDILKAKNSLLSAEIALLDVQLQNVTNRVNMFLALGGDFK